MSTENALTGRLKKRFRILRSVVGEGLIKFMSVVFQFYIESRRDFSKQYFSTVLLLWPFCWKHCIDVIGRRGWRFSECSGRPIFICFIKENWIFTMTRYAKSDSEAILWWYHCIVCGLNRTIEHVVNLNMTWLYFFYFWFDFVCSNARCRCCPIVCLCFQVMQIKQIDCKMSTKKNSKKSFRDTFGQLNCTHKNVKPRESR